MADVSDKKRLRQVQQQDLTESRLNDDFVFWLKTKGVNYLLILLIAACAWMAWNWWGERKQAARDRAWNDFAQATLPQAFDEVARLHAGVDSVAILAWLRAGDAHLREVQTGLGGVTGLTPGPDGLTPQGEVLDAEALTISRNSADAYYERVIEAARGSEGLTPFRIGGLFGRAAIAESRHDFDGAKRFLEEAAAIAEGPYPLFAERARLRIESLPRLAQRIELPTAASLPFRPELSTGSVLTEEMIRQLQSAPPAPPISTAPEPLSGLPEDLRSTPEPEPEPPAPSEPEGI